MYNIPHLSTVSHLSSFHYLLYSHLVHSFLPLLPSRLIPSIKEYRSYYKSIRDQFHDWIHWIEKGRRRDNLFPSHSHERNCVIPFHLHCFQSYYENGLNERKEKGGDSLVGRKRLSHPSHYASPLVNELLSPLQWASSSENKNEENEENWNEEDEGEAREGLE